MKKADKYSELFKKEYLMGPNSMRLLEEMLRTDEEAACGKTIAKSYVFRHNDNIRKKVYRRNNRIRKRLSLLTFNSK